MNKCHICGAEFESEYSNYVCDLCRIERIRKRIAENTSYVEHIADLQFLMEKFDGLIEALKLVHGMIIDPYPGELVRAVKTITKTLGEVERE